MTTDTDRSRLDTDGWRLIPDVLDRELLTRVHADLARYFPDGPTYAANRPRYDSLVTDRKFPFAGDALNEAVVHPNLLSIVTGILGTTEVLLCDGFVRAKYFGTSEGGGKHHTEYAGKNSIAYPRDDGIYRQMPMLLYLSDVDADLGPTYVVSRTRHDGHLQTPWGRGPEEAPALYEAEIELCPKAGSLLILSTRTFHRGSPIRRPDGARFSAFVGYHAKACTWMEAMTWPGSKRAERDMTRFLEASSPAQREAVGFPGVDDPYWNEETVAGIRYRFPGMDLGPYEAAIARRRPAEISGVQL